MEKSLEFKSQICTTREQSERLLKLGLKKETADCALHFDCVDIDGEVHYMAYEIGHKCCGIPAWSLHRLIEIASNVQKIPISFVNWIHSDVRFDYDYLIDVIQWFIECGYINEFYLEEK